MLILFPRIRWMRELGFIFRTKMTWIPKKPICNGNARDFNSIGLHEVSPMVTAYVFAVFLSIFVFGAEIGYNYLCRMKSMKFTWFRELVAKAKFIQIVRKIKWFLCITFFHIVDSLCISKNFAWKWYSFFLEFVFHGIHFFDVNMRIPWMVDMTC